MSATLKVMIGTKEVTAKYSNLLSALVLGVYVNSRGNRANITASGKVKMLKDVQDDAFLAFCEANPETPYTIELPGYKRASGNLGSFAEVLKSAFETASAQLTASQNRKALKEAAKIESLTERKAREARPEQAIDLAGLIAELE